MDFTWDCENRLVSVGNGTTNIVNTYDYKHRRVRKTVGSESHAFAYDVWNLLAERINDTDTRHYFWGLDLSDSLQGAGGVGGLLAVAHGADMYYPIYDNNGNITAYLDDTGNIVASYEYNAFGEAIAQSGNMMDEFAFRFSTKYHDNETGLYYYGYRFYDPALCTWLNRDPIEEDGGLNLYGFCGNNSVDRFDVLGLLKGGLINFGEHQFYSESKLGRAPAFLHENSYECKKEFFSKCYRITFSLIVGYNINIAMANSPSWQQIPDGHKTFPVPQNWVSLSQSSKQKWVYQHEQVHVNAYGQWWKKRSSILRGRELMKFKDQEQCEWVGRSLIEQNRKSWEKLYAEEKAHSNW